MDVLANPTSSLILLFAAFKTVLLSVAYASPGLGYDTSTHLFQGADALYSTTLINYFPFNLVRWDAIYYVSTASRGYLYEQEWAFGWGLSKIISLTASLLPFSSSYSMKEAWSGVIVSNVSHLLSVLMLYQLARLLQTPDQDRSLFPFVSACLHIVAPAGVFLSAPYGESLFSLLNFSGLLAYCVSRKAKNGDGSRTTARDVCLVLSGIAFGLAATVRSNSIFNGTLFAYDVAVALPHLPKLVTSFVGLRYLICLTSAGLILAAGFVGPQAIAYFQYCGAAVANEKSGRIWCTRMPPSIYTFVQGHYWNVGFLRYWTLSNLPLFMLAGPMLAILFYTGIYHVLPTNSAPRPLNKLVSPNTFTTECLRRLAIPQVLLAILVLTTAHVQVVTRVASGYPLPYLWLASNVLECGTQKTQLGQKTNISQTTFRFMIMYALIQGGLYASFLPPA